MTGLLQRLESVYGADYEELTQPSSVVSITHIKALYPYTEMPSYGDKNLTITGMILSQYATLETWTTEPISNPTSISTTITRNSDSTATITITTDEYPDSSWTTSPGTYSTINSLLKMTVGSKTYTGTLTYDKTWIDGIIQTHYVISDSDGNLLVDYATTDTSYSYTVTIPDIYENTTYYTSVYYQYSIAGVASVRLEDAVSLEGLTYTETDTNTDTEVGDTIIE